MTGSFRVLETVFRRGALGVLPIDVSTQVPAGARLRAWAQVLDSDLAPLAARRTSAGVHAFSNLPSLLDEGIDQTPLSAWEFPPVEPGAPEAIAEPAHPVRGVEFGVVFEPTGSDLLTVGLAVTAPLVGALETLAFPSPARPAPSGFTAVRGDLRLGAAAGAPARFALVELRPAGAPPGGEIHLGLADGAGSFCVLLPTPDVLGASNGDSSVPLAERTVAFELAVRFEPAAQEFLVRRPDGRTTRALGAVDGVTVGVLPAGHRAVPTVDALLAQSAVELIDPDGGASLAALPVPVPFAAEAVAKTHDDPPFVLLDA